MTWLTIKCPRCRAIVGERCVILPAGVYYSKGPHAERVNAAPKAPRFIRVPIEPTMGQWDDFNAVFPVPFEKFREAYAAMIAGVKK